MILAGTQRQSVLKPPLPTHQDTEKLFDGTGIGSKYSTVETAEYVWVRYKVVDKVFLRSDLASWIYVYDKERINKMIGETRSMDPALLHHGV